METDLPPARQQAFLCTHLQRVCIYTIVGYLHLCVGKKTIMIGWRIRNRCRGERHLNSTMDEIGWRSIKLKHSIAKNKKRKKKIHADTFLLLILIYWFVISKLILIYPIVWFSYVPLSKLSDVRAMMPIYWCILYILKRGERKSLRKARSGRGNRRAAPIFSVRVDSVVRFNGVYSLVDSCNRITRTPQEEITAFEMYGSTRHRGIECSESAVRRDPLAGKKSQKLLGRGRERFLCRSR